MRSGEEEAGPHCMQRLHWAVWCEELKLPKGVHEPLLLSRQALLLLGTFLLQRQPNSLRSAHCGKTVLT